jgi:hypothetical protein
MKIKKKFKGDLATLKLHRNDDTDTLMGTIGILVKVAEDKAEALFGEIFHAAAFGTLTMDDEQPVWAYESMTPKLVCERHMLTILGLGPVPVQPKIASIKPVKDESAVIVELRLPIVLSTKQGGDDAAETVTGLGAALLAAFGKVVDVKLQPSQAELPGVSMKKTGNWGNEQPVAH